MALGPVGWCVLGAEAPEGHDQLFTYDCWKPVLHDTSPEPSNGKLLKDVLSDPRIENIFELPELVVENVWHEKFQIQFLTFPNNIQAAHAVLLK